MTNEDVLAKVREAFANVPRPDRFVPEHCCECSEHNETLASQTPDSIGLEHLGNAGWDPMCFATADAFKYYLPGMLRLALGTEYYLDQLLFHLNVPDRVACLNSVQASAVLEVLWVLQERFEREIAGFRDEHRMEEAMQRLERVIRGERD